MLNVHRTCLALCRENANLSLDKLHNIAENGLKDQLKQLGFDLSGSVRTEFFRVDCRRFADLYQAMNVLFPHHLGHYIGLDVHDCPGYSRGYNLKAGQCITIEPCVTPLCRYTLAWTNFKNSGIYVPDDERWPAHFRGIGIRIEDSVCVGDEHPIVLSPEAVKEVSSIAVFVLQRDSDLIYRSMISRHCVVKSINICILVDRYPPNSCIIHLHHNLPNVTLTRKT